MTPSVPAIEQEYLVSQKKLVTVVALTSFKSTSVDQILFELNVVLLDYMGDLLIL